MISNVIKLVATTAAKEGLKNDGIAVVIRNALISAGVGFATTKVLEKTYNAIEQNCSSKDANEQEP